MNEKKIFIQGPSQIGKSTLLLQCLKPYRKHCGGFVTQRMIDGEETRAFCLTPVEQVKSSIVSYRKGEKNIFLERSPLGWLRNDEVFGHAAKILMEEVKYKQLLVLDEIGGVELMVPEFREVLFKIILSDQPLLGVFKSAVNRTALARNVSLESEQVQWHRALFEKICKRPDGLVLTLYQKNNEETKKIIKKFLFSIE